MFGNRCSLYYVLHISLIINKQHWHGIAKEFVTYSTVVHIRKQKFMRTVIINNQIKKMLLLRSQQEGWGEGRYGSSVDSFQHDIISQLIEIYFNQRYEA